MSTGYSPLRRWLRQERVKDAGIEPAVQASCTRCGCWLNRIDERGNLIGSTYFIGNERLCWRCQHERGYGAELD